MLNWSHAPRVELETYTLHVLVFSCDLHSVGFSTKKQEIGTNSTAKLGPLNQLFQEAHAIPLCWFARLYMSFPADGPTRDASVLGREPAISCFFVRQNQFPSKRVLTQQQSGKLSNPKISEKWETDASCLRKNVHVDRCEKQSPQHSVFFLSQRAGAAQRLGLCRRETT